eukprot:CAMPEP_0197024054 /NCGR_PEP_ID=MMETSP1384-20130603/4704_1 /TAXON_ID=29189 /ORGANISM="Ammonia sp." /LENGTH=186 /DNA_ID=CAMNT_0042452383 /DNA_START=12 /DNA_END=572 /DNA_ORIENTATION=+
MLQFQVVILLACISKVKALNSAPVLSPANTKGKVIKSDYNPESGASYAYTTKIKKKRFFHHHYIYHHEDFDDFGAPILNEQHDHEIKIPTEERFTKLYIWMDINKDGDLSEDELRSMLHIHKHPEYHPRHQELLENALSKMDANSDGIIQKDEYLQHMKKSTKELSNKLLYAQVPKADLHGLGKLI